MANKSLSTVRLYVLICNCTAIFEIKSISLGKLYFFGGVYKNIFCYLTLYHAAGVTFQHPHFYSFNCIAFVINPKD